MTTDQVKAENWQIENGQHKLFVPEGYVLFYECGKNRISFQWVNFADPSKSFFSLVADSNPEDVMFEWRDIVNNYKDYEPKSGGGEKRLADTDEVQSHGDTMSKAQAVEALGFAHGSSIEYYIRTGRLDAVSVAGFRAKRVTVSSVASLAEERGDRLAEESTEPTMSKQETLERLGFAHISSVNYYIRTNRLTRVKVAGYRGYRITTASVEALAKEREANSE